MIRAVLFDVDGTLYRQGPLRLRMALELAVLPWTARSLRAARAVWRRVACFRRVREELRALGRPTEPLATLQYEEPARRLGDDPAAVRATIEEWMHRRPLCHLERHRRPGLVDVMDDLQARGLERGVFSDYPPAAKLEALGVADRFSVVVCATDPEVNAFKPHPRGFEHACTRWGLAPEEVLYVGDRADTDEAGARGAGMPACLVGHGFERVRKRIDGAGETA